MTETSQSYFHRGGERPLLGATIPEHFAAVARKFPKNEAVVCAFQGRRLDYAALAVEIDRLARGLMAFGFGKGDRIGVWSTDNVEWVLLQLATELFLCGAVYIIGKRTQQGLAMFLFHQACSLFSRSP